MMLNCLFAMVVAAFAVGILNALGVDLRPSHPCPACEGEHAGVYSGCEMWQDMRSVLSFFLGALLCAHLPTDQHCPEEEPDKYHETIAYSCLM